MVRVRGQPRVDHLGDGIVALQPLRQRQRVVAMRLHPQVQRLQAAQGEETVERALHRAHRVLQEGQLFAQFGVVAHHQHAADHVGMAVEVLGRRMHDDVGAVFERALQDRRGEGVVDRDQQAVLLRDGGDGGDVDDLQQRVGRGLDPHQPGLRRDRGFERRRIREVDEAEVQRRAALADALEQPVAAAVQVVHRDDVVAAVQQFQQGRGRRQPGREREAAAAALQRRHAALVGEAGRVVGARILEALVHARAGLRVGAGRVDRRHHRAGGRIRRLAAMDRQRAETEVLLVVGVHRGIRIRGVTARGGAGS